MAETPPLIPSAQTSRVEEIYPTLTAAQVARIALHGRRRQVERGEVLLRAGELAARFFVVISGSIEVAQLSGTTENLIVVFGPGKFTGEVTLLAGRRGLVRIRAREAGEVIEVDREHLLAL